MVHSSYYTFMSLQTERSLSYQHGSSNINSSYSLLSLSLVRILQHRVVSGSKWMVVRNLTRLRVGTEWSSKQQDEWLWSMNFVMHPATRLLDSEMAPLLFEKETVAGHLLVCSSWKKDMSILIFVVLVLLRVLDFIREMRHSGQ